MGDKGQRRRNAPQTLRQPSRGHRSVARRETLLVLFSLAILTAAAFSALPGNQFITYDDADYITGNPHVRAGLTLAGLRWAFTTGHSANWHPLTWISHMADVQVFGLNPVGHHLHNLALHIASALILFLVLKRLSRALWPSAFVAALFAVHPLRVESVAWAAERKDVLAAFFWMLTMWMYVRYVEKPARLRYAFVVLVFGLGLLAKPMLVTLPLVLLLLDYWPLGRLRPQMTGGAAAFQDKKAETPAFRAQPLALLIREKAPLFAMAVLSSAVTFLVQRRGGSMAAGELLPFGARAANALMSYIRYIGKTIWPADLAFFYPYSEAYSPGWKVAIAGVFLAGVLILAIYRARKSPHLLVGWSWWLGTLVPVIGIVQVGAQSMADRYTYIPSIGLAILVVWSVAELATRIPSLRIPCASAGAVIVIAFGACTWFQVRNWRDSVSLYTHALNVTTDNCVAHGNLGIVLAGQGKMSEAAVHYAEAIRIKPDYAEGHNNLGRSLDQRGKPAEAMAEYAEAIRIKPDFAEAHYNLGSMLAAQGKLDEGIAHLLEAVRIKPDYADAHNNLGIAFSMQSKNEEAIRQFSEAIRIQPDHKDARNNLRIALAARGKD